jgi:hypothetical protein
MQSSTKQKYKNIKLQKALNPVRKPWPKAVSPAPSYTAPAVGGGCHLRNCGSIGVGGLHLQRRPRLWGEGALLLAAFIFPLGVSYCRKKW